MTHNPPSPERQIELMLGELRQDIRRTRDLAHRATVMAGMGLIVGLLVLCVAILGLDGMRENMDIVASATDSDLQDAGTAALDQGSITLSEASKVVEQIPELQFGDISPAGGE